MNQIINMIIRQVMGQLVRRGVNAGFDQVAKVGKRNQPVEEAPQMSRQERKAQRAMRQQARQTRQAMKAARRVTRL